jgi:multiple sugar transport system permease protein
MFGVQTLLLIALVVFALGPLLLLAKFAVTPTQDILSTPLAFFPNGVAWENLHAAWFDVQISVYFANTVVIAVGSWAVQLVIATTGGYVLSILRPRYARMLYAAIVATLFIPGVVLLVPLYLTILDPPGPLGSLLNTYWAIWLPAAATAFNVVLMKRFFDNLPSEILEAAYVDGAGPFRLLWSVVLPMSKPILGVVSVFAVIASWKDFLWPLLVLTRPELQPLSVRLPTLQATTDLGTLMAGLAISTVIPILFFLVFQRFFLRGAGLSGAIKG